jgi:hypothetical protein
MVGVISLSPYGPHTEAVWGVRCKGIGAPDVRAPLGRRVAERPHSGDLERGQNSVSASILLVGKVMRYALHIVPLAEPLAYDPPWCPH